MLERLQVTDFQRHEKMRVKFDVRTTTITGPSDAGKSSLLRAVRWLAFNRPLGDGFIRHGQESCSVKLWVDGRKIERRKSKRENVYLIDGKELKAVGTDVPEEVARLLNLTADNWQGQHDPPFWFSLTAGEVAKRLNSVVDLEVIDRSSSWLASRLRKAKTELEVAGERASEAEGERDGLSFVADLAPAFLRVQGMDYTRRKTSEERDGLADCLKQARERAQDARTRRSAAKAGIQALALGDAAGTILGRLRGLSVLVEGAERAKQSAEQRVPDIAGLEAAYNGVGDTRDRVGRLQNMVTNLRRSRERLDESLDMVTEAQAELDEKTEGVCPLCGGEWK